jgi:hypothetical protein
MYELDDGARSTVLACLNAFHENVRWHQISSISGLKQVDTDVILKNVALLAEKKRQGHFKSDHFDVPSRGELSHG